MTGLHLADTGLRNFMPRLNAISHNPLERQETRRQQRAAAKPRYRWLAPLLVTIAIIGVALTLRDVVGPTRDLALYLIWIIHVLTGLRAIVAGADAINREHIGNTWDILVMTGISARQIVIGKWLGILHQVAPSMLMLGIVRLLMLPVFILSFINNYAWRFTHNTTGYYGISAELEWIPWASLLAVTMVVLLTMLDVMACAALGLAASALIRQSWLAMIAAFCVRLTPVVIFASLTREEVGLNSPWRILSYAPLALADGGTAPLHQLVMPTSSWTMNAHLGALPGIALSVLLLLVLIVGALWIAVVALRAGGALPHSKLAVERA